MYYNKKIIKEGKDSGEKFFFEKILTSTTIKPLFNLQISVLPLLKGRNNLSTDDELIIN